MSDDRSSDTEFLNPSLLRRQPLSGACRPLTLFGPGAVAASVSKRNLADASGTALKRLIRLD